MNGRLRRNGELAGRNGRFRLDLEDLAAIIGARPGR
jgi:hypothetical protein